jgi:hypothetical protein
MGILVGRSAAATAMEKPKDMTFPERISMAVPETYMLVVAAMNPSLSVAAPSGEMITTPVLEELPSR